MNTEKSISVIQWMAGFGILLFLISCGSGVSTSGGLSDSPTSGRIKVAIDDSYRLLLESEIYTFEAIYKGVKIDMVYCPEEDLMDLFLKDSVPLIVCNRQLSEQDEKYLNARQIVPRTTLIANDAVVFIVNPANQDTSIFYDKIAGIFQGHTKTWKDINPKSQLGELKVVFDNYKSSNPRYFREKFGTEKLPPICFAVNSNKDVIDFVEKNKSALGVISVNWISDKEDTVSNNFLKRVRVVGISQAGDNDRSTHFYKPYQAYIAQGDYPFTRKVYMINRQPYTGLAYGFSSFVAGEKGQLIILRSGMVPAAMPVRIVEIKH